MPEVFRRRVEDRSVREALSRMQDELLPAEIREDGLANWVRGFDELRNSGRQDYFREHSDNPPIWAMNAVVLSALQKRIPFYFATLFHIGRQWKVSESALRDLDKASDRQNLALSTQLTLDNLRRRDDRRLSALSERQAETTEALAVLLGSAGREHSDRLREARRWWGEWRNEVDRLRSQVDRLEEVGGAERDYRLWRETARFVLEGSRPSQLRAQMEQRGLKFAEGEEKTGSWPVMFSDVWAPLLLAGLASGKEPYFEHFFFEWRHMLHDLEHEARYGELRRAALSRLTRKYGSDDPFEHFLPMRRPATEHLRYLCVEHRLPGGQNSPWLDAWQRCLDDDAAITVDFIYSEGPKGSRFSDSASGFARAADSAIKRHVQDDYEPGESWDQFVQRLFEAQWVYNVAGQMAHGNRNTKVERWSFSFFRELVGEVVLALSNMGYRCRVPDENRLRELWDLHPHTGPHS